MTSNGIFSLLDDPRVLAGLEKLDAPPTPRAPSGDPHLEADAADPGHGLEELDDGLEHSRSPDARHAFPSAAVHARVAVTDDSAQEPADASLLWRLPYVAVWLFLMSLGAAAAALVFHVRVLDLITRWNGSAALSWLRP